MDQLAICSVIVNKITRHQIREVFNLVLEIISYCDAMCWDNFLLRFEDNKVNNLIKYIRIAIKVYI